MKSKSGFFERILQNNKVVLVMSLIFAIALWAVVKINYSDQTSRVISDVKVGFDTKFDDESDYIPFFDEDDLIVNVEVTGKGYNINAASLTKDDITVEATVGFIDTAGYKVLSLTAKSSESGVSVSKIEPSTIKVFFDKKVTDSFNVEAKLKNKTEDLAGDGFVVGAPVPSISTVNVSGPATVIQNLKKVYFEASVDKDKLPLKETTEVAAKVSYSLDSKTNSQFLKCDDIDNKTNSPTITIPIAKEKVVPVTVKFVNEPKSYENNEPKVYISPEKVKIAYNPQDGEDYESFNVGTVDFRKLTNSVNTFTFEAEDKSVNIVDSDVKKFVVKIDMSAMSKKEFEGLSEKVVLLNQKKDCNYSVNIKNGGLDKITIVGPKSNIDRIKAEDLQIEINVSSLNTDKKGLQTVDVSNISIQPEGLNDCWVYGNYTAQVTVSKK